MNLFSYKRRQTQRGKNKAALPNRELLLSYQVANLQGLGARERQEDAFAFVNVMDVSKIRKDGLLAVVADGMGGMKDGKLASETVIAGLKQDFGEMDRENDLAQQLCQSVFDAGEKVYGLLNGDGGSTVVACIIFREQLYFVSVGDSFLYLKRGQELIRLNREQNCQAQTYLETIRSGSMDPTAAHNHREKAALTQFLGMDGMDEMDFLRRPFHMKDEDVLLICSDGVGGVLTEQELIVCLGEENPDRMCAAIEAKIRQHDETYQDNYTALIIKCGY